MESNEAGRKAIGFEGKETRKLIGLLLQGTTNGWAAHAGKNSAAGVGEGVPFGRLKRIDPPTPLLDQPTGVFQ